MAAGPQWIDPASPGQAGAWGGCSQSTVRTAGEEGPLAL